ncbi:PC4-domain-containing protein [Hypoxylon sp. NC1633]|nr:PC4-domain-containing protein [Hypoxylon sp. NC1633]
MGRTKNLKRSRREDDEEDDVSSEQEVKSSSKPNKKTKKSGAAGGVPDSGKDDDGNSFWSLGGTRRATISPYNGKTYINIREYYTDASGSLRPGKKGIMLGLESYNKLLDVIPSINAELQEDGHETTVISTSAPAREPPAKAQPKKVKSKAKANIEATSDEEEDEED